MTGGEEARLARRLPAADAGRRHGSSPLLVLPLVVVLVFSFGERAAAGGYQAAFTLANMLNLPARWTAFRNTLVLAPTRHADLPRWSPIPLAYFLAVRASPRAKLLLLILVIVPFWTSFLIRTYAWIFILGGKGMPALLDYARHRRHAADQHALRRADRHRLRLSAADGVADLCQPGEARQAAARGLGRSRRRAARAPSCR